MSSSVIVASGNEIIRLPSWGRSFWQDPNDGELFLAYASGDSEVDFVTSSDSGVTWTSPQFAFYVDTYSTHDNFDTEMDRQGNVHCGFRFNDSGCYQLLHKKVTGGWIPSGVGPAGFVDVADGGVAKGFNGMVTVYDIALGAGGDISGPFPAVRIAAKDSSDTVNAWAVNTPFTAYPFLDDMGVANNTSAGPSGGYPIFTNAGEAGGPQVTYMVDNSGIVQAGMVFGTWSVKRILPIKAIGGDAAAISGFISNLPFGPSMSFGRSIIGKINPIIISDAFDHSSTFNWDMLTTAAEPFSGDDIADIGSPIAGDFFGRVDSIATFNKDGIGPGLQARSNISLIPFVSTMPGNVFGANPRAGGAASDISHGDTGSEIKIYFLTRSPDGSQIISRILCNLQNQSGGDLSSVTRFNFSSLQTAISGIRSWAPAGRQYTGGSGNIAGWHGFKALRHPTDPGIGVTKKEIVATVGSRIGGLQSLVIWDFENSIEAGSLLKTPTYSFELTASSGNNPLFVGISDVVGLTPAEALILLDGDTSTSSNVATGDSITFEFTESLIFSRLEIAWQHSFTTSKLLAIAIDTSVDGTTFKRVHTIPQIHTPGAFEADPHLIKASSEFEVPVDSTINEEINAFVGKFVKLTFTGTDGPFDVRELRLYGPHTTAGKIVTDVFTTTFQLPPLQGFKSNDAFGDTREGKLPTGWRTSGDWDWFVRTSGDFSKLTGLPSEVAPQDGHVASGVFKGTLNGRFDGTAIKTAEWMPINSSGILETDITIPSDEVDETGAPGRTIKWDTRYNIYGDGLLQNDPEDDSLRFFVVPEGSGFLDGELSDFHAQGNRFTNVADWFTVKTNVSPGIYTLRWIFKRGNTPIRSAFVNDQAVAYIDNTVGATSGIPSPSIFGFIKGESFAVSSINGFFEPFLSSQVQGFASGTLEPEIFIHGYVFAAPNALGGINAYLLGMKQGSIDGYTIAGEDLRSFPTGEISCYVAVQSGTVGSIKGYLLGMKQGQIDGYVKVKGSGTQSETINSYLAAQNMIESGVINAFMLVEGGSGFINAYLFNAGVSGAIKGYLKSYDATSSILGYLETGSSQITGVINTYVKVSDNEGNINAYMLTNEGGPFGYLKGNLSSQFINSYLLNTGVSGAIQGYLNTNVNENIDGYMKGAEVASGSINSYLEAFASEQINGYMAGISGFETSQINSFIIGVSVPNEQIKAYLIAVQDDICSFHGSVPLPALPSYTLPSSIFFV